MKKIFEVALGVVTSVGGFLEIGSIATAAQGGARWGPRLLWAIVLGGLCSIVLVEMSGRFSATSRQPIAGALRERFGWNAFLFPCAAIALVTLMVLAAEIGGVAVALELATGWSYRVWALPVVLGSWLLLWKGNFGLLEKGVSLLGLVTVSFIVGAFMTHPDWAEVARGALPSLPAEQPAAYGFTAVSIFGASLTPYLFFFYSSGAIEDRWDESHLGTNRLVAGLGMGFGTLIAVAVLVVAAQVLHGAHIQVDHFRQLVLLLTAPMGRAGFVLFVLSLGIACLGAILEISLGLSYLVAQGLGWEWGENHTPRQGPRFHMVFTVALVLAGAVIVLGLDPIKLTNASMALTSLTLPLAIAPFLVLMNDPHYLPRHRNGPLGNGIVIAITALAFVAALVAVPLQLLGGGG